jgi:uncharacterized protein involved in exopolysaccharide biosynthesis
MTTASPDDIDITAIWRALRRSLPKLIILSLAVGIGAFAILSTLTPRYTSEAQIQVVAPKEAGERSSEAVASRLDKEAIKRICAAVVARSGARDHCRGAPRR